MLETYEEYLQRTNREDNKFSWMHWKIEVYGYSKEKAQKRAESQYYPLSTVDLEQTNIGLNIKYLRKEKGITQIDLMKEIGLSDHMLISRWERGIYIPDASQTKLLADYFNVKFDELIKEKLYERKK